MTFNIKQYFTILFILVSFNSYGDTLVVFDNKSESIRIGQKVFVLEDPKGEYSFQDVVNRKDFSPQSQIVPQLGLTSSVFWIKIHIQNLSNHEELFLDLSHPMMDEVDFIDPEIGTMSTGEYFPFSFRFIQDPDYIFPVKISKGALKTVYFRIESKENIQLPIVIGKPLVIVESLKKKDFLSGIYWGIMLVMILYNFFIYFTVNDRSYLLYVLYIIFILLTQASTQGYTFQYLYPNFPWLARHSLFLFPALVGVAGIAFMKEFLKVKEYAPYSIKVSYIFYFLYSVWISMALLGYYQFSYQAIEVTAMGVAFYLLIMPIIIYRKGYKPALFFLIAWIVFILGIVIFVFKDLGILPYNNFTRYTMQTGSAIETILLSLALANRIKTLQKEKEISQAQALSALQENERIMKQQKVMLEEMVNERTRELQESNEDLAVAIKELKETQSQLVQSEKMASLGQLTAGVAHEINNPINFVSSSIRPLKRDISDLITVLDEYSNVSIDNFNHKVEQINKLKEELDLPYVKEEIESLLKGIEEGAHRTAEIVRGLRTFSRVDETDLKRVDLHEGIDSTLILLTSMLRDKVVVEKNYGDISLIECYAGKLNQVFMNILNNAIHAIGKKHLKDGEGRIVVSTSEIDGKVEIRFKDNGIGMPLEVKNKIFDPFFTTKDVGEGTGLGLSIVYNIIDNHKGKIEVFSEEGVGTEFVITLPKFYS